MDLPADPEPSLLSKSLESKIHSFLQGNPAFSAFDVDFSTNPVQGGESFSPVTGTDNQDGTPVRDEGGGTPTQDEMMDNINQSAIGEIVKTTSVAQQSSTQQNSNNLPHQAHMQPLVAQNGQVYQSHPYGSQGMSEHGITAHNQQISAQTFGPVPGERAPGSASSTLTFEGFQGMSERGWYSDTYPEASSQQPQSYSAAGPGGTGENKTSGLYSYQTNQTQDSQELVSQQVAAASSGFFRSNLPPVPNLPPPPLGFDVPPATTSASVIPPQQQPVPCANTAEMSGARVDSIISGMVVHDHQHKSMFHPHDPSYELDRPHPPHPEDLRFHNEHHHQDALFFQEGPYLHPDDRYYRPGSPPPHYPRGRGRLTPPLSPSEDPYYTHIQMQQSPPPRHYAPRRPPPHLEIHHPGLRPPHRPPHPAHHPHPRGPPPGPFPHFRGPDPRLRGKRPGPRGGGNAFPVFPPKRPFLPPRY